MTKIKKVTIKPNRFQRAKKLGYKYKIFDRYTGTYVRTGEPLRPYGVQEISWYDENHYYQDFIVRIEKFCESQRAVWKNEGQAYAKERKRIGLSQEAVATMLRIGSSSLSRWENGEATVYADAFRKTLPMIFAMFDGIGEQAIKQINKFKKQTADKYALFNGIQKYAYWSSYADEGIIDQYYIDMVTAEERAEYDYNNDSYYGEVLDKNVADELHYKWFDAVNKWRTENSNLCQTMSTEQLMREMNLAVIN